MTDDTQPALRLATRSLSHRKPTRFRWQADAAARTALAQALDLQAVESLSLEGEILPEGRNDFRLEARLHANAVQSCVVTLAAVPAKVETVVLRRYLADLPQPTGEEVEIPEDDSQEPLPETIDLEAIAAEALALALPDYPRAPGAELGEAVYAEEGVAPLRDADLNPFAALAGLLKPEGGKGSEG